MNVRYLDENTKFVFFMGCILVVISPFSQTYRVMVLLIGLGIIFIVSSIYNGFKEKDSSNGQQKSQDGDQENIRPIESFFAFCKKQFSDPIFEGKKEVQKNSEQKKTGEEYTHIGSDSSIHLEYGINRKFDDPNSYGKRKSHYGNGKYPPDWNKRREAIWSIQNYQCDRCGIYKGDATDVAVHHVIHLANGGGNQIENLVGICGDCHALMHPSNEDIPGAPDHAAMFPDRDARDEVAVIRWPSDNEQLTTDLEHLSETSESDRNVAAVTQASVPTSATDAKRASSELQTMLVERGFVPRTSTNYIVRVKPVFHGFRGLVTRYKPTMTITHDASAYEVDSWTGLLNPEKNVRFTGDATKVDFVFEDGDGNEVEQTVSLDNPDSEERISPTMSPPPLTTETLPKYAIDATLFSSWAVAVRGFIPALLFVSFAEEFVLFESPVTSFLSLVILFGTLFTVPTVYKAMQ